MPRMQANRIPFLTDLDSRAAVKGSRDPLGVQAIWGKLGREVVGNLTTVTTSVTDFVAHLLGFYFVEKAVGFDAEVNEVQMFLRWEQLCAYARGIVNEDWSFRGTERAHKAFSNGKRLVLSAEPAHQILGNQRIYGLWGLYTTAARASGLVVAGRTAPTEPAREFIEATYLPRLAAISAAGPEKMTSLLAKDRWSLDPTGPDRSLLRTVASCLVPPRSAGERVFFRKHLAEGGGTSAVGVVQRQLAGLFVSSAAFRDPPWSPGLLRSLSAAAREHWGDDSRLATRLDLIRACESLLSVATSVFAFLQTQQSKPVTEVAASLSRMWPGGVDTIEEQALPACAKYLGVDAASNGDAQRWLALATALAGGAYARAIELALEQNQTVMKRRGTDAPWIEIRNGVLRVDIVDESAELPAKADLPGLWRHSYFIDALRTVCTELAGAAK